MNRFRFRFSSVLRYREILEESKKREFGTAMDHLRHEEDMMRSLDDLIAGHEQLAEESSQGPVSVAHLQNMYNYARRLDHEREGQEKIVHEARAEADKRRDDLIEATRNKKIFERLEERDREAWNLEARKEEQAFSDEISVQNYTRRTKD